jgi:hypothetical protein
MRRTATGLFVASNFNFLRFRATNRTVTLPNGERAKVTVDDSGTVQQTEHGDVLDALVRPAPIHLKFAVVKAMSEAGGFGRPNPIRTKFKVRKP